jgi:hypothetical protein
MTDPLDFIEEGCREFQFMGMKPITTIGGDLVATDEGYYCFVADEKKVFHPLETVLAGEMIQSGDRMADAAARLGVTDAWLNGFIDGFAQGEAKDSDSDYLRGFLAADALRQRCPELFEERER